MEPSLTDDDVDEIRFNVLGVQTSVSMPFDINAYVTDDRLIEMDGELESKDDNNLVRLPKESRSRRRQTYDFDEARVGASGTDSMEEIPLFDTSIITITSSSSGSGLRRALITIQLLENGSVLGIANGLREAGEWTSTDKGTVNTALKSDGILSIGTGSRKIQMYKVTLWVEGNPIPILGKTTLGEIHFNLPTSKFRNGVVILDIKSKVLAVCKNQADAARVMTDETVTVSKSENSWQRQKIGNALRLDPSDEKFGKIYNHYSHIYNVRWLTDSDKKLGVTKKGKKKLPGWNALPADY